ncbi:MAG: HEAT repeat domain-containing protein, partial [Planctomycetes bacterium]|nr:HEAT repeat domain-containing protein [Planctomycetota bacterium]
MPSNGQPKARMLSAVIGVSIVLAVRAAAAAEQTPVEHVTSNPPGLGMALGTKTYEPSDRERPFFEKLPPNEVTTGGLAGDDDITTKSGRYVGWFGIVREIEEDAAEGQTVLTVEHKYFDVPTDVDILALYFDGLTDVQIQALSFNGSGDFQATFRGLRHSIPLLSLVRIYGTVAPHAAGQTPRVNAEFVRVWHWGTFTFLGAWGEQRGSQKWRKLNQVVLDNICEPHFDPFYYYQQRLGKRAGSDPARRRLLKAAGPMAPALETRIRELIEVVLTAEYRRLDDIVKSVLELKGEEAAIAVLIECLTDPDEHVRRVVSLGLSSVGPKAVPPLILALQADDARVRHNAAYSLHRHGPDARDAVPALTAALEDETPDVRGWSAVALGRVGQAARPALPRLKGLLSDPEADVRLKAAEALWRLTFKPQPSVPVLAELLENEDCSVRGEAAEKLSDIGPEARDAVPALATTLKDQDDLVRSRAARALCSIGPGAKAAVPALLSALHDESQFVRADAADALGKIGAQAETVVPALIAATSDTDHYVRAVAVDALGRFGPAATDATSALVKILEEEPDALARGLCGRELVKIDPTGKTAVPVLIKNLRDANSTVRHLAAMALADLGPSAADAVEPLTEALEDPELVVRYCAARALWKIDQQDGPAVPVLLEALNSDQHYLPRWAAENVLVPGPDAVRLVPALVKSLKDHDH